MWLEGGFFFEINKCDIEFSIEMRLVDEVKICTDLDEALWCLVQFL